MCSRMNVAREVNPWKPTYIAPQWFTQISSAFKITYIERFSKKSHIK